MAEGFKKGGKFHPTGNNTKPKITKEQALKEYTSTTLTSIRQEDAINFLKRKGIPEKEAIPFVRKELQSFPKARIGEGFG